MSIVVFLFMFVVHLQLHVFVELLKGCVNGGDVILSKVTCDSET